MNSAPAVVGVSDDLAAFSSIIAKRGPALLCASSSAAAASGACVRRRRRAAQDVAALFADITSHNVTEVEALPGMLEVYARHVKCVGAPHRSHGGSLS